MYKIGKVWIIPCLYSSRDAAHPLVPISLPIAAILMVISLSQFLLYMIVGLVVGV